MLAAFVIHFLHLTFPAPASAHVPSLFPHGECPHFCPPVQTQGSFESQFHRNEGDQWDHLGPGGREPGFESRLYYGCVLVGL